MSRNVIVEIAVTLVDGADPDVAAEKVRNLFAADPDDAVPEIETVTDWGWRDDT